MMYICCCTKILFQLNYFVELAYNGTDFHGWQVQPNASTVQELINKAFSTVFRREIEIVGAGRTDTGVHASQMFAHVQLDEDFDTGVILYKLNAILPDSIAIYNLLPVTEEAHARFDAVKRSYEYRISLVKDPFKMDTTWQLINKELNVAKMNEAAQILLTYTDFQCFSRTNSDVKTFICDVTRAEWKQDGDSLIFYISADRFLRNMVRAIVGTLIEVGVGKTSLQDLITIIESKDRTKAGPSAPARGLFLTEVNYPSSIFINE